MYYNNLKKRVAVVQSSYIPWKGYFDLINMVDEFILYDDAQYTRRDWRNRNIIKDRNSTKWLTIPVKVKGQYLQKVKDTLVSDPGWNQRHWKAIRHSYSKAMFFQEYKGIFEDLYMNITDRYLSYINHRFIVAICKILGIDTNISWSMDYKARGNKTMKLVELCKASGATEYLSGPSAKGYLDEGAFKKEKIKLEYMDYSGYPEYRQLFPPFEHKVSIIDLIFSEGPNAHKYMRSF